jgi:hypothetical protein
MKLSGKRIAAVFAVCLSASAASAQLRPVPERALTLAAQACLGIPADPQAARDLIVGRGWAAGEIKDGNGKALENKGLAPYGRDGVLLLLTTDPGKAGCLLMADVKPSLKSARAVAVVAAALGVQPISTTSEGAMWTLPQGQAFMLRYARKGRGANVQMIVTPINGKTN